MKLISQMGTHCSKTGIKKPASAGFLWAGTAEYSNSIPTPQSNKGLPFGNPLFYLAEA